MTAIAAGAIGRVVLAALGLIVASVFDGCVARPIAILANNDSTVDVVVRIEWPSGHRDSYLAAATTGIPAIVDPATRSVRAVLLDAETCVILGSTDLPAEAAVLYFREGPDGDLRIQAYAKDIRAGPLLPEDHRCGDGLTSAPP